MGQFSLAKLFGVTIRESATDGSDFTNPDADYRRLYLGEDGVLHLKDSAGTVTDVGAGAGGAVATDVIWDAKGDLAGGTGANTASKLTVGANWKHVIAASGETTGLAWTGFIGAKAYNSAGQSLNDVVIPLDSEEFDTHTFHSTSSNTSRMTIPSGMDGIYHVTAGTYCSGSTRLAIKKNGTTLLRPCGPSTGAASYLAVDVVVSLAATDYVEMIGLAGGARTYGDNSDIEAMTSLAIVFLGP